MVLNETAGKHTVIAFVGRPHRLNDQGSQLRKSLLSIGFEHYLQADLTGWVLYLEGSTDLAILRTLAQRLDHPALAALERPYDEQDLFVAQQRSRLEDDMRAAVAETEAAMAVLRKPSPWSHDTKATDDFLDGLFGLFLDKAGLPRETMYKKDYHRLAEFIPMGQVDAEISAKLDAIARVAAAAKPRT